MVFNVALSLVTRIAVILIGLASAVITARTLGTAGRGEYVYISTLGLLAVQFANIGFSVDNARNAAITPALAGILAGNSLWISLVLGLLASAGMATFHVMSGNSIHLAALAVLVVFVPSTLYGVLSSNILVGLGQMNTFNFYTLGGNLVQLVAIFVAGMATRNAETVLWANAGAVFLSSLILFALFWKQSRRAVQFEFTLVRQSLGFAGRIYIVTLLGFAISRINILMLGTIASKEQLGLYSIAMQFVDALLLLPATIAMILFPELVKVQRSGSGIVPTLRAAAWTATLLLPPVVVLGWLAPTIIGFLFGPAFIGAASVLRIMLPGIFALGVATIFSQSLSADGVPKMQIGIWIVAGITLVATNLLLIPTGGALGAGWAFACSYTVAAIGLVSLVFWRAQAARRHLLD